MHCSGSLYSSSRQFIIYKPILLSLSFLKGIIAGKADHVLVVKDSVFFSKNTGVGKAVLELPNYEHIIKSQLCPDIKCFHLGPLTHTAGSYRLLFFPLLAFLCSPSETKGNYSGMAKSLEKMNSTWHWLKRNGCFFPEVCSGVNHWRAEDCGELSKEISTIASCPLYKEEHSFDTNPDHAEIPLQRCLKNRSAALSQKH